jgi:hypothetical protein
VRVNGFTGRILRLFVNQPNLDDYNLTVEIARLLGERGHRKAIIFLLNIVRKLALDNKIDLNVIRRLL